MPRQFRLVTSVTLFIWQHFVPSQVALASIPPFAYTDSRLDTRPPCWEEAMFRHLLETLSTSASGITALDMIAHIHDLDRWGSFDRHHETSRYCLARMREHGLDGEITPVPADGETRYGDWVMPQAWNCRSARLRVLPATGRGEVVLCDYRHDPCSLVMYSKPTPPGGVAAEALALDGGGRAEDYQGADVQDKIVLTSESARGVKVQAVERGAAGVVTDYMPTYEGRRLPLELPDGRAWQTFGPDYEYGGWGMKKGHTQCWGFVLTPRQGQWLRNLLRREQGVRLHAQVDARFYNGTLDIVTGAIPGRTKAEVLMNGHLSEVGAIDDASGCGVALEVLRCVHELIEAGKLRRPRRGLRMLFTYECMGTMAAVFERPDIFRNAIAGVTLDCVGGREALCRAPLDLCHNPHAQSSYTDTLLRCILTHLSSSDPLLVNWRDRRYAGADAMIADPSIGVPSPLLMECPYKFYHSSTDTPDKLDPEKLRWIAQAVAAYVYFIANAGEAEARWLAEEVLSEGQQAMIACAQEAITAHYQGSEGIDGALSWRRLAHLRTCYGMAIDSVAALAGRRATRLHRRLAALKRELAQSADAAFERAARACGVPARKPRRGQTAYYRHAATVAPRRLVVGEFRMARIPAGDREEWTGLCDRNDIGTDVVSRALFWTDGGRSVAQVEELVAGEMGKSSVRLMELYEGLERHGYVKLRRAR